MEKGSSPVRLVQAYDRAYPGCYDILRGSDGDLTEAAARALVLTYGMELSCGAYYAHCLAACCQWDITKRVYLFAPELGAALVGQTQGLTENDTLPLEVLNRLPCKSFYMQAPNAIAEGIDGCFVWLDASGEEGVLRMVFLLSDMKRFVPAYIRLLPDAPLKDCLQDARKATEESLSAASRGCPGAMALICDEIPAFSPWRSVSHNLVLRAVQLALYLASENADVSEGPTDTEAYYVGKELSSRLKGADLSGGTDKTVRAHIRKGHYHRFWKGPRKGERQLVIRWVEPVLVGGRDSSGADALSVVPVKAT